MITFRQATWLLFISLLALSFFCVLLTAAEPSKRGFERQTLSPMCPKPAIPGGPVCDARSNPNSAQCDAKLHSTKSRAKHRSWMTDDELSASDNALPAPPPPSLSPKSSPAAAPTTESSSPSEEETTLPKQEGKGRRAFRSFEELEADWMPQPIRVEQGDYSVTVVMVVDPSQPLSFLTEAISTVCNHKANRIFVRNCVLLLPDSDENNALWFAPGLARVIERGKGYCQPRDIRVELFTLPQQSEGLARSLIAPVVRPRLVVSSANPDFNAPGSESNLNLAYLELDNDWEEEWQTKWMHDLEQFDDDWLLFDDEEEEEEMWLEVEDNDFDDGEILSRVRTTTAKKEKQNKRTKRDVQTERARKETEAILEWENQWERAFTQAARRAHERREALRFVEQAVEEDRPSISTLPQFVDLLLGSYVIVLEHGVGLVDSVAIDNLVFRLISNSRLTVTRQPNTLNLGPSSSTPTRSGSPSSVRVVGGKIVDYGQMLCLSAGMNTAIEGFIPRSQRDWSYVRAHRNVPRLHHRYPEVVVSDSRVAKPAYVDAVSGMFAVTHDHFVASLRSGAHEGEDIFLEWLHASPMYRAVPFCSNFSSANRDTQANNAGEDEDEDEGNVNNNNTTALGWLALYDPTSVAYYMGDPARFGNSLNEVDEVWIEHYQRAWEEQVHSSYALNKSVVSAVVWAMECSAGQALGFTREAVEFVLALEEHIPISVHINDWSTCQNSVLNTFPAYQRQAIRRLAQKKVDDSSGVVLIIHRDPGVYSDVLLQTRGSQFDTNKLRYTIGRSMYETDRIPSKWLNECNNHELVQEIWVPSDFNVETFSNAGVKAERLHIIGEPVDVSQFDPTLKAAFNRSPLPVLTHSPHRSFAFLSVFKWEERKNWRGLLAAYFAEFTSSESVCLYIRSTLTSENWRELDDFLEGYSDRKDLPAVVFLHKHVDTSRLPQLFASMDAFVLPTRGEGWGLPIIEAMSMDLPVIATNWSGVTEFLNARNGFPLSIDGLQLQREDSDHQWANPSQQHLQRLMREVFGRAISPAVSPRNWVVQRFSPTNIASQVVGRLQEITKIIVARQALLAQLAQRRRQASLFGREFQPITIVND